MAIPSSGRLPAGQHAIQTENKTHFDLFASCVAASRDGYAILGLAVGNPGLGKSVSAYDNIIALPPTAHTGLRRGLLNEIMPGATAREVVRNLVIASDEKPCRGNRFQLADQAIGAIRDNDIHYIIHDEADRLDDESFDILRHIHDEAGCPGIFLGLPSIRQVINRHEKIKSRIGFHFRFTPLDREETLTVILPQLIFPGWSYDPTNSEDIAMGVRILDVVGGSFRKLRNVLQLASQLATRSGNPSRITREVVDAAIQCSQPSDEAHRGATKRKHRESAASEQGAMEEVAELRHDYKARKRGGGHNDE